MSEISFLNDDMLQILHDYGHSGRFLQFSVKILAKSFDYWIWVHACYLNRHKANQNQPTVHNP